MIILKELEKTKKLPKLNLGHVIAFVIIAVLVLFFIVSSFYLSNNRNTITTEITMLDTQQKTISVDMIIIRDENILSSSNSNIVSAVTDGTRVGINDTVAYSFSDSSSAANVRRLAEVTEELEYYIALDKKSSYVTDNTTTYDNKIIDSIGALSSAVASGDFLHIDELKANLRDTITSKQTATGVELDLTGIINTLSSERDKLQATTGKYTTISAGATGYYISDVDGYEAVLDYNSVDDWTIEQVEAAMSASPSAASSNQFGRLVNSYYWYLACVVDTDDINELHEGSRYTLGFYDSAVDEITCTVYRIKSDAASGKSLVIFSCNIMTEELASLRNEHTYIVLKNYTGYKIDNRALRTDDENQAGVYALDGHTIYFRNVDIIYSDDEYSLVTSSSLGNYDEYVVTGQDLYNGKIIK